MSKGKGINRKNITMPKDPGPQRKKGNQKKTKDEFLESGDDTASSAGTGDRGGGGDGGWAAVSSLGRQVGTGKASLHHQTRTARPLKPHSSSLRPKNEARRLGGEVPVSAPRTKKGALAKPDALRHQRLAFLDGLSCGESSTGETQSRADESKVEDQEPVFEDELESLESDVGGK